MSHTLQSALESGQEARFIQIDFSAAFDRVKLKFNHQCILYNLCSVGVGGSVLSLLTQFLSIRSQHVMVQCWRKLFKKRVSRVPHGQCMCAIVSSVHLRAFLNSGD